MLSYICFWLFYNAYFAMEVRKMKRILLLLCAAFLVIWIAGISSAAVYDDTYDPSDMYLSASSGSHFTSWTHSIVADQGAGFSGHYGFNPATEDVISASIRVWFCDDSWLDSSEDAKLNIGTNVFNWEVDNGSTSFTVTSLISLNQTGTINAVLTATNGDFYFQKSTLTAETKPCAPGGDPVPEPGTLILLGSGLVGLAGYAKIRIKGMKK
jgi:hypothetical protein